MTGQARMDLRICQGVDWQPRADLQRDGTCGACGRALTTTRWFCRAPAGCRHTWLENHHWGYARPAARKRANGQCVRCGSAANVEVNHIVPRDGQGYARGCHHHQDNLEALCHPCHVETTRRQRVERAMVMA